MLWKGLIKIIYKIFKKLLLIPYYEFECDKWGNAVCFTIILHASHKSKPFSRQKRRFYLLNSIKPNIIKHQSKIDYFIKSQTQSKYSFSEIMEEGQGLERKLSLSSTLRARKKTRRILTTLLSNRHISYRRIHAPASDKLSMSSIEENYSDVLTTAHLKSDTNRPILSPRKHTM